MKHSKAWLVVTARSTLPVSESLTRFASLARAGTRRGEDLSIQPRARARREHLCFAIGERAFPEGEAPSPHTHARRLALSRSSATLTEGEAPRGTRATRLPGRGLSKCARSAFGKQRCPSLRGTQSPFALLPASMWVPHLRVPAVRSFLGFCCKPREVGGGAPRSAPDARIPLCGRRWGAGSQL